MQHAIASLSLRGEFYRMAASFRKRNGWMTGGSATHLVNFWIESGQRCACGFKTLTQCTMPALSANSAGICGKIRCGLMALSGEPVVRLLNLFGKDAVARQGFFDGRHRRRHV